MNTFKPLRNHCGVVQCHALMIHWQVRVTLSVPVLPSSVRLRCSQKNHLYTSAWGSLWMAYSPQHLISAVPRSSPRYGFKVHPWLRLKKKKNSCMWSLFDLPNQNRGECNIMKHIFKSRDKFCIWNMNNSVSKYSYLLLHRTEYTSHTCEYVIKDYKYSV